MDKTKNKSNLNTELEEVDEQQELPPDPKVKLFGRQPGPIIKVRFDYTPEPTQLLQDLTEFIFKHAKMMEFDTAPPDYWKTIVSAVLSTQSYEH